MDVRGAPGFLTSLTPPVCPPGERSLGLSPSVHGEVFPTGLQGACPARPTPTHDHPSVVVSCQARDHRVHVLRESRLDPGRRPPTPVSVVWGTGLGWGGSRAVPVDKTKSVWGPGGPFSSPPCGWFPHHSCCIRETGPVGPSGGPLRDPDVS